MAMIDHLGCLLVGDHRGTGVLGFGVLYDIVRKAYACVYRRCRYIQYLTTTYTCYNLLTVELRCVFASDDVEGISSPNDEEQKGTLYV
jgi:hypothetical protein